MASSDDAIGFDDAGIKTIGLCMIVKDEAAVIERCLDSVRPLIDYVLIEDTGSTDGTQEIVRAYLRRSGLPGEVIDEPWRDFAYNRSHALARLRENAAIDYALIMDADDRLVLEPGFDAAAFKTSLSADVCHVWIRLGGTRYHRPQLCSNRLGFHFRGVVHEYLEGPPGGFSAQTAAGFYIAAGVEGARSKDPDKYRRDAAALEQALAGETDPFLRSRYTFYLAQSWRDCGEREKALAAYLARAELGGWDEEVFVSLYNAGKLQEALGEPTDTVVATLLRACETVPRRAEALHAASRACRAVGRNEEGCEIARRGLDLPEPETGLFIEPWIYRYGLRDEFAINAYWAGHYEESLAACEALLRDPELPGAERARIERNAEFAYRKLAPVVPEPTIRIAGDGRSPLARHLRRAFDLAMARHAAFDAGLPGFEGVPGAQHRIASGRKYRMLANRLIGELDDARYLEIGSYTGSTLCTATAGNKVVATAIDNWSLFGGPVQLFLRNLARFRGPDAKVTILESDFRAVDYAHIGRFNVYLYDGPHREADHYDAVDLVLPALDETFVLMVDDWDWDQVREGTWRAIRDNGLAVDLAIEVLTTLDSTTPAFGGEHSDWHNGYLFAVLSGNRRSAAQPAPALPPARDAAPMPRVLLAILAKQKEPVLPFYLMCIEALDYPKEAIVLYVRTNNNTDRTAAILKEWLERVGPLYAAVEYDDADVAEPVQDFAVHEWNALRFKVLGRIRQDSLAATLRHDCDFYFVADVDNFLAPGTLRALVAANQPIVGPLLRHVDENNPYSNYHEKTDAAGYFANTEEYYWLLYRRVVGLCRVEVIHCTYLVRRDVIPRLVYDDGSGRHEYVVFSASARRAGIPQYLDTREVYGYLTLDERAEPAVRRLGAVVAARLLEQRRGAGGGWQMALCCGLNSSGSTWLFNLVREICLAEGWQFQSLYAADETDLLPLLVRTARIVVKLHAPPPGLRAFIAGCGEPMLLTVRDPRDAVVSLMRRFGQSFEAALDQIAASAASLAELATLRPVEALRYEDGFVGSPALFDRVAALLGARLPAGRRDAILARLSPEQVSRQIDELAASGRLSGGVDLATHWHLNHVGDGKVGKFADALTRAQQEAVARRTAEFCARFGYDPGFGAADAEPAMAAAMDD